MTAEFHGKIALITGASGGIGAEIARQLAQGGAIVALHYNRSEDDVQSVLQSIIQAGGEGFVVQADLSQPEGVDALINQLDAALDSRYGNVAFDILVNNAGKGGRQRLEQLTAHAFADMVQINLTSPLFLIQKALTRLRHGGRIINISSIGTRSAWPEMVAYAPTKAGIEAITLSLAPQLGERAITINAVLPGATATAMNPGASDPDTAALVAKSIALGRVGKPKDIAAVVTFLASEAGGWITGQSIDASGGQRI